MTHVRMYMHIYVDVYVLSMQAYICCMNVCSQNEKCLYVHMDVRMLCVFTFIGTYVCVYVHMYVQMYGDEYTFVR